MIEILENFAQIAAYFLFDFIPAVVAIPFGELGKPLIEISAFRYIIGIIALIGLPNIIKSIRKIFTW